MSEPVQLLVGGVAHGCVYGHFPLYRRATFKRQRAYLRTERVR